MQGTTAYDVHPGPRSPGHGPGPGAPGDPAGSAWTREVQETAAEFARCVAEIDSGALDVPLPGGGRTSERFAALTRLAERDLSLVRLVEGHVDAVAILAELEGPAVRPGERWGVWAAEPPGQGLTATRGEHGWVVNGLKRYCSGAHSCTHALVTAGTEDGRRLFAVATGTGTGVSADAGAGQDGARGPRAGSCRPVEGSWQALGMAASDSADVTFTEVPAVPVGGVEGYVNRPGFQHGGIGVAACWYGGALAVARVLGETAGRRGADPLTDAHLGAVDMRLHAAGAVLDRAATEIDRDPADTEGTARLRSLRVRGFVESVCADVLTHVGRATGAEPLCHNPSHTRHAADLTVYIRQHHGERNLAELGRLIAEAGQK
ncbi:acyl-CoA dehydrogenase [Streptomyces sp. NBC_00083]|uniref:acyl-CoA dehydrogenase n=1 Tax=Streptomyces sp. NBC_00083 TaxID=2975647 RepID=UPI002256A6C0|nr:acyl-CoA dehydrogenase [Streptomyces sp. NBC_00083]MCX5387010.1 acyl-CoA dehydrogenase [Streptomyces sp. NBC_00083]